MADKSKVKISELSEELFAPYKNAKTKAKTDNVYNNWDFATNGLALDAISNNILSAAAAGASQGLSVLNRTPSNSVFNTGGSSVTSPNPNPSVYPTSEQVQSAMREYAVLKNQPKYDFTPSEYQLKYGETIENLLKQLNDRNNAGFSYDPSADPTLQEYFKQYDLQADAAIDKSIGTYAPAGGGMSSTALALANEAAAAYEAKKNALVPEFYNAAYNKYLNQNATLADLANSYLALENNNYNIWANKEEQRQAAAAQKYEQDYQKWLQDLASIGYTVNKAGQAVKKEDLNSLDIQEKWQTSFDNWLDYYRDEGYNEESIELAAQMAQAEIQNRYGVTLYNNDLPNAVVNAGFLAAQTGALAANGQNISGGQNTSQLESDAVIDEMLDSIYSGTNTEDFQKTLSDDENTRLGYLNSLVSVAQEDGKSDVFSSFLRDQYSLSNVGTGGLGYAFPALEAGYDGIGAIFNLGMLNAKYTKKDFKNYFIISGYSESKADEMAGNVSKRYQEIDKNRSQYGTQYTADAIALAIKEELEKNPV